VIWGFLTVLYAVSNPVFNVPDEPNHFLRCYEISEGHLLSDYSRELNAGGRELPFDITELHENTLQPQSWYEYEEKRGKELNDDEDRHFVKFSNTALYSPLSYLPQVTGISAARLFSKNIYVMAVFGRLANWLCITILIYGTLKLLPYGKEFFMLLALMPMSLFEAFSLAPDGMVFALSSFLIAFVLDIRMNRKMLTFRHYAALYLMAVIMCSMKIVYLPFCLYYFLIPGRSFRHGNRSKLIHSAICVLLVGGISLGWMRLCSRFLTTPGTDSAAQLKWIIARPFTYLMLILRFLLNEGGEMVMEAAGRVLGMRDIPIPSTF
jgi:uncharacterized membrane protein